MVEPVLPRLTLLLLRQQTRELWTRESWMRGLLLLPVPRTPFVGQRIYARWPRWMGLLSWRRTPHCSGYWLASQRNMRGLASTRPGRWMSSSDKRGEFILSVSIGARTGADGPLTSISNSIGSRCMPYRRREESSRVTPICRSSRAPPMRGELGSKVGSRPHSGSSGSNPWRLARARRCLRSTPDWRAASERFPPARASTSRR